MIARIFLIASLKNLDVCYRNTINLMNGHGPNERWHFENKISLNVKSTITILQLSRSFFTGPRIKPAGLQYQNNWVLDRNILPGFEI